ncbi:MAG: TlpA disulfide reductase family protein [Candidatus Cloacimonadaceae bacterium]|nr:TlpA disulfide reductase family protein [Candidatus Cloacimonadaceae bacterium]MDP3113328.1 TlpA disulfide reductase family protein [Candidatus Cloacimonadaceae bacterium]
MKVSLILITLCLIAGFAFAEAMPDFRLPDINNKNVTLADLLGKGPILMDFWADYCTPCKNSMPYLNELALKYDSLTVVLVSIDAPKGVNKAKNYLKSKNFKFVTLFDSEKTLAKKLNVTNPPHTFILDKEGTIVYSHLGFEPGIIEHYDNHIRVLLNLDTEAE